MAKRTSLLERATDKRSLNLWERRAACASTADIEILRKQQRQAWRIKSRLDEFLFHAEDRLTAPFQGTNHLHSPKGTDWFWRPDLWRGPTHTRGYAGVESGQNLSHGATIFHDCVNSDLTFRQTRNFRPDDLAPYGVRLDVFTFNGSYLSLVIDLPDDSIKNLKKTHMFKLTTDIELERHLEIFARLNIKHGPNVEQIVRELPLHQEDISVEFDLGYSKINEKRVEKIWLDLIFENPNMSQITLRDITLNRTRRAEL